MKKTILTCLSLFMVILGCSKNSDDIPQTNVEQPKEEEVEEIEEPIIVTYLTIKTGCLLNYGNEGNWVIIYDEIGNLIDYKTYQENQIITFESDQTEIHEKYTVTFLSINQFLGSIWNRLNTSTEILNGATIDYSCIEENSTSNPTIGNFNLTIKDVPDNSTVTSINASNGQNVNFAYSKSSNNGLLTYESDLNILELKTDYIISIQDGNQDSKYYVLENYEIGDEISINYEDFYSYTDYTDINYPEHNSLRLLLYGSNNDEGYGLNEAFSNGSTQGSLRLGKLNRFNNYKVLYEIQPNSKYAYSFKSTGEFPTEIITPPQPSITIIDSSIQEFKFETSLSDFQSKTTLWKSNSNSDHTTTWNIDSSANYNPIINELPEEIIEKYPHLSLNNLEYSQTIFQLNYNETMTLFHI